ncbi:DUF4368 domain-containing protein [Amphibacillus cookii]
MREFIDKIVVYQAENVNGKNDQHIQIYYNYIGVIEIEPNVKVQMS